MKSGVKNALRQTWAPNDLHHRRGAVQPYYGGACRKLCLTAFAGVALKCPVAHAVA